MRLSYTMRGVLCSLASVIIPCNVSTCRHSPSCRRSAVVPYTLFTTAEGTITGSRHTSHRAAHALHRQQHTRRMQQAGRCRCIP